MIKWLMIPFLMLFFLNGFAQVDSLLYVEYMEKGDRIFSILKKDSKNQSYKFDDAVNAYNAAMLIYPDKADSARERIKEVFIHINEERMRADSLRSVAEENRKEIEQKNEEIIIQITKADSLRRVADTAKLVAIKEKEISYNNTLANAPYKYIRIIRDGPVEESDIKTDTFDVKLLAYSNHMDTLRKIMDTIPVVKMDYDKLRENLYYNNDLYEKIYYCLVYKKAKDSILKITASLPTAGYFKVQKFNESGNNYSLSSDSSAILYQGKHALNGMGQHFTCFMLIDNPKRILAATNDNYILVYKLEPDGNVNSISPDSLAMGATVTALDFDEASQVLFFGTIGGDIGFINYKTDKRNQPVYSSENFLIGSKITAVDFFKYEDSTFLMVAGFDSKGVVYEIGKDFLKPGKVFYGNILPDPKKELGDIMHAKFDEKSKLIILESTNYYTWDPFTGSVLEKYKKVIGTVPHPIMDATNFYNKSK